MEEEDLIIEDYVYQNIVVDCPKEQLEETVANYGLLKFELKSALLFDTDFVLFFTKKVTVDELQKELVNTCSTCAHFSNNFCDLHSCSVSEKDSCDLWRKKDNEK